MSEARKTREVAAGKAAAGPRRARGRAGKFELRMGVPLEDLAMPHRPVHPGRFLQTRFLVPLGISQIQLAAALGVSRRRINELLRGHRGITADTALRLGFFFGMDPHFWLTLQMAWDLHLAARQREAAASSPI